MWGALAGVWKFRSEIVLGFQLLGALRKSAREIAREYIRRRIEAQLKHSLVAVAFQIGILAIVWLLDDRLGTLYTRLLASSALWVVSIYNAAVLIGRTIPEMRSLRRTLRSRSGYALKYLLQVSIATELMQWNALFLFFCLSGAISSRTLIGAAFSYFDPWLELWSKL